MTGDRHLEVSESGEHKLRRGEWRNSGPTQPSRQCTAGPKARTSRAPNPAQVEGPDEAGPPLSQQGEAVRTKVSRGLRTTCGAS